MKDHTHLKTTVVRVYGSGVRIIPHSPQFSLMSVFALISMKIHLSTKELYGLFWTMSLLWSPCRLFFFGPQSHPTDSATSLIGHIHLKWTDHGRHCTGSVVHPRNELVLKSGNMLET